MDSKHIKIGTRGSPLALKQAQEVKEALTALPEAQGLQIEVIPIITSGDQYANVRLADIGGKGLFTKEIEEALQGGMVDLAVHSMKDVETWMKPDFCIPCMLKREDPRDSWVALNGYTLSTLPQGSRVGTSSLRRTAQILNVRPDLEIVPFRGKVDTRIEKLRSGRVEATLLAVAGLNRLQRTNSIPFTILEPEEMVPAVGQGALGVECLASRQDLIELLASINHPETYLCVSLERTFLEEIDGTCGTPVGALAVVKNTSEISFIECVATPDGTHLLQQRLTWLIEDAEQEIRTLGKQMHQWLIDHQ